MPRMDEQEATDKLEELVGSVDRCFRLMRLYQRCQESISGDRYNLFAKPRKLENVFRAAALRDGYNNDIIDHYLNHIR